MKLFNRWSFDVKVNDPGLKRYINLAPCIIPRSFGRNKDKNLIEKFITKLMVPGHKGKKHFLSSGKRVGKFEKCCKILKEAFFEIEKRTKQNPIEVLVRAIENASIVEEVVTFQVGGAVIRRTVITSPKRRLDLALMSLAQTAYRTGFGKKKSIVEALVDELIGAYENDPSRSLSIKERERIEKEAEGAR